jgi:hypothetical protein
MFATKFMPAATKEQVGTFNELQRKTTSAECAARYYDTTGEIDVVGLLADLQVPTFVMHARADAQVPFELEQDPATERFFEEVSLFLAK